MPSSCMVPYSGRTVAQKHFGAGVVAVRIEVKAAWVRGRPAAGVGPSRMCKSLKRREVHLPSALSGLLAVALGEAPAGQNMRERNNILLRVAAIHSHRVEF